MKYFFFSLIVWLLTWKLVNTVQETSVKSVLARKLLTLSITFSQDIINIFLFSKQWTHAGSTDGTTFFYYWHLNSIIFPQNDFYLCFSFIDSAPPHGTEERVDILIKFPSGWSKSSCKKAAITEKVHNTSHQPPSCLHTLQSISPPTCPSFYFLTPPVQESFSNRTASSLPPSYCKELERRDPINSTLGPTITQPSILKALFWNTSVLRRYIAAMLGAWASSCSMKLGALKVMVILFFPDAKGPRVFSIKLHTQLRLVSSRSQ